MLFNVFVFFVREDYHSAGLFWVGSFTNSILVFLPGSIVGKLFEIKDENTRDYSGPRFL